jgi:hypothetical protein
MSISLQSDRIATTALAPGRGPRATCAPGPGCGYRSAAWSTRRPPRPPACATAPILLKALQARTISPNTPPVDLADPVARHLIGGHDQHRLSITGLLLLCLAGDELQPMAGHVRGQVTKEWPWPGRRGGVALVGGVAPDAQPGIAALRAQPLLPRGGMGLIPARNGRVSRSRIRIGHRHHTQGSQASCS